MNPPLTYRPKYTSTNIGGYQQAALPMVGTAGYAKISYFCRMEKP